MLYKRNNKSKKCHAFKVKNILVMRLFEIRIG